MTNIYYYYYTRRPTLHKIIEDVSTNWMTRLTSRLFVLCSASLVGGESWGNINRDLITLSFTSERSGG